jgi:hypothetical protein
LPQRPQFVLLNCVFVQAPLQRFGVFPEQPQVPMVQVRLLLQALLQRPQFVALVWRLTHWPLQSVWPVGQAQLPMAQVVPPAQVLPQVPQFDVLVWRFTHWPLQREVPVGQAQVPA